MVPAPTEPLTFAEVGRIPAPGDNAAIAIRTLPAGTRMVLRQLVFEFSHTVLEGHRFAIYRIRKGEPLLSWGLPFGLATRDIEPGEYLCNEKILRTRANRQGDFQSIDLPAAPNFLDHRASFTLDPAKFQPGAQVSALAPHPTFNGLPRDERRGTGTRNYIVVLGANSRTAAFARKVAAQFSEIQKRFPNIDGVVAVDHTEGGGASTPQNLDLTLRTLAGFMVNPNVGAVLCVDYGPEILSNRALQQYLAAHNYPVAGLIHDFLSIDSFEPSLSRAAEIITSWLPRVNGFPRVEVSIQHLRLGLQCGGSDAFSGVSGNPLVGILSRETVAHGGSANLAETDELMGAESYVLANVRDLATAQSFLATLDRFQQWAAQHGHSAEGNPSGGNRYRGLYNISIKSIGAARKKDPATRLDHVIDYGELMTHPGFYFMDSPGNDLESIAGQVAAGCNLILFTTGNGSITNFPFVPTIKIMTTTRRFELVRNEMDFNAGRYQDGEPLEDLGREAFHAMLRVASGQRTAGEMAGHAQVQLWREWRLNPAANPVTKPGTEHLPALQPNLSPKHLQMARRITESSGVLSKVALILPTSLCSSQIALMIAEKLNRSAGGDFDRAVALPHTEGCGNSGGQSEQLFLRTMSGYLAHPFVSKAVLLEHGCEKTHNDAFRNVLRELGIPASRYGFQSVQMDGGIQNVTATTLKWFKTRARDEIPAASLGWSIALHGRSMPENVVTAFALLSAAFEQSGASVVLSEASSALVSHNHQPSLAYGERLKNPGVFKMECPTDDPIEIITGLAATGAQLILAYEPDLPLPANPLVPTLQLALHGTDADLIISDTSPGQALAEQLLQLISDVQLGKQKPASQRLGNLAFQITRGYEGISL